MNQAELARQVGVSTSAITSYIRGKRMPTLRVFLRIVRTLRTTPNYLLGYDATPHELHAAIPRIVNLLRDKYYQITTFEKDSILAALVGKNLTGRHS